MRIASAWAGIPREGVLTSACVRYTVCKIPTRFFVRIANHTVQWIGSFQNTGSTKTDSNRTGQAASVVPETGCTKTSRKPLQQIDTGQRRSNPMESSIYVHPTSPENSNSNATLWLSPDFDHASSLAYDGKDGCEGVHLSNHEWSASRALIQWPIRVQTHRVNNCGNHRHVLGNHRNVTNKPVCYRHISLDFWHSSACIGGRKKWRNSICRTISSSSSSSSSSREHL